MYANFAAQFAPEVALPSYGEFDTPEPQAGLAPPEHLYDSRGTPLNYIQTEGGPREFLVPRGQAAFAAPPSADNPQAPVRMSLRGRQQQTPDYPLGASTGPQPQDLMRPQQSGTSFGQRATLPIPPAPVRNGPRAVISIPPSQSQIAASGSIQQRQTEDQVIGAAFDQRAMRSARNPVGSIQDEFNAGTAGGLGTLQRLIEDQGFNLSDFLARFQGRSPDAPSRRRAPGAEMESELRGMSNPHDNLSLVDSQPTSAVPQVTPTSSVRWNGAITQVGPEQQTGRAEEVAAMLRANGIRVTSVTRNRNARRRGHPEGNSIDIDPRDRGEAMRLIGLYYPGLAHESFDIGAGQNLGGGVRSTGHHSHIDLGPVAGPRRTQNTHR